MSKVMPCKMQRLVGFQSISSSLEKIETSRNNGPNMCLGEKYCN